MTLSPADRAAVLDKVAEGIREELRKSVDLESLIMLPLDAVAALTLMSPAHVQRVMAVKPLGKRKKGVSLKELKAYLKQP